MEGTFCGVVTGRRHGGALKVLILFFFMSWLLDLQMCSLAKFYQAVLLRFAHFSIWRLYSNKVHFLKWYWNPHPNVYTTWKTRYEEILKVIPDFKDNQKEIKEHISIYKCSFSASTGVIIQGSPWRENISVFPGTRAIFHIFNLYIPPQITYSLLTLFNKRESSIKCMYIPF